MLVPNKIQWKTGDTKIAECMSGQLFGTCFISAVVSPQDTIFYSKACFWIFFAFIEWNS